MSFYVHCATRRLLTIPLPRGHETGKMSFAKNVPLPVIISLTSTSLSQLISGIDIFGTSSSCIPLTECLSPCLPCKVHGNCTAPHRSQAFL